MSNDMELRFVTQGNAGPAAIDYARQRVATVLDHLSESVRLVRITLQMEPIHGNRRSAHAEVHVDLDGDLLLAHADGDTLPEAIDVMRDRLRVQLHHRAERERARVRGTGHHN